MAERIFFDTNVTLYCFDTREPRKQERAKDLMAYGASSGLGIVSYQVMQEFCCVASNVRRMTLSTEKIMAFITHFLEPMNRVPASIELLAQALQIKEDTQIGRASCRERV